MKQLIGALVEQSDPDHLSHVNPGGFPLSQSAVDNGEKTYIRSLRKKNQTTWNVDTFQRVSLYTRRMPNQHPLREFWLIKQALCAGINNSVA